MSYPSSQQTSSRKQSDSATASSRKQSDSATASSRKHSSDSNEYTLYGGSRLSVAPTLSSKKQISQMSSQQVHQLVNDRMKHENNSPYGNQTMTVSPKRVKVSNARRKLVYASPMHKPTMHQPSMFVQPNWNPATAQAPIYHSPPSVYNNSLPRPMVQQLYSSSPVRQPDLYGTGRGVRNRNNGSYYGTGVPNGSDMRQNGSYYGTIGYQTSKHDSPRRVPLHSTPKYQVNSTNESGLYQKNKSYSPNTGRSPKNRTYRIARSQMRDSEENITRIGNNLYLTEYF